jgi:anti-sigma regulatory factor (Ser/Thr protein kinase)
VSVRDEGRWRTAPPADEGRRRGLFLMAALMDDVSVRQDPDPRVGTEVVMVSTVVAG